MENVSTRLRDLRMQASPRLSVRAMAVELDLPLGTYSNYESSRYKKSALPLELTRKIAGVLSQHNVDPAEVMKLAGLSDQEVEPEAKIIETARPTVQYVTMSVAMPSEAALKEMFRTLLVLVPDGATKDEAAAILARRLPAGFAAIGPLSHDQFAPDSFGDATIPQSPATGPRENEQPSRT